MDEPRECPYCKTRLQVQPLWDSDYGNYDVESSRFCECHGMWSYNCKNKEWEFLT